jgi:hypothetical protein
LTLFAKTDCFAVPEPIIPASVSREFNQVISQTAQSNDTDSQSPKVDLPIVPPSCIKAIASTTQKLPPSNFNLLKTVCWHLNRIASNDQVNRMNTSNLGLIFIPTLGIGRVLFHCFVEHADQIWGSPSPNKRPPPVLPKRPIKDITIKPGMLDGQPDYAAGTKDDMMMQIVRDGQGFKESNTSSPSSALSDGVTSSKKNDKEMTELREMFERDFGSSISGPRSTKTPPEKPLRSPRPDSPISVDTTIRGNNDRPVFGSKVRTDEAASWRRTASPIGSPSSGKSALDYFRSTPTQTPPNVVGTSAHLRQKSAHQASVTSFSESNTKPRSKSVSATETEVSGSRKGGRVLAIGSYFESRQ